MSEKIKDNAGEFDVTGLFGATPVQKKKVQPIEEEEEDQATMEFPWGKGWINLNNPYLWRC